MGVSFKVRAFAAAVVVGFGTCVPAHALVKFGTTDEIFVRASATVGYDSNLFANNGGRGDHSYALEVGAEYTRNAGLITLTASATLTATRYGDLTSENSNDPAFKAEFDKKTGRTTGALKLAAQRENRADASLNVRSESWNYSVDLNVRYPVIERYSLLGNLGYSKRDYTDNSFLSDLENYTAGLDLAYRIRTGRDLLVGYRFRDDETSALIRNQDHAFTVGLSGQILTRLTGSIRGGYNYRESIRGLDGNFSSWTGNAALTWSFSQRLSLTGQLNKDFSTTATNISTDTLSSSLRAEYAMNAKIIFSAGTGYSDSDFLGRSGGNRHDNAWTWDARATYLFSPRLNASISYTSLQNWSTLSFADFTRRNVALMLSARF